MRVVNFLIGILAAFGLCSIAIAQSDGGKDKPALSSGTFSAFNLRGIGPAFMSGRIADIAIVQDDPATWYVAVGSGGVWKTENAGTTWTSLFDGQGSYSIGALGLDPSDPSRIWVGTGENHGGRHLGFGDGIYLSEDWRSDLDQKGSRKFRTDRQDHRSPRRFQYRMGRGARARLEPGRRARRLQDQRWWRDLGSRSVVGQ